MEKEINHRANSGYINASTAQSSVSPISSSNGPTPLINGKISRSERERRIRNKLCLYCGSSGHILVECPKKKAGKRPVSPSASAVAGDPSGSQQWLANPFLVKISLEVQGQEIFLDALIDSGASSNFLDTQIVEEYGFYTSSGDQTFQLADGSDSSAESSIGNVLVTSLGTDGTSSTSESSLWWKLTFNVFLDFLGYFRPNLRSIGTLARFLSYLTQWLLLYLLVSWKTFQLCTLPLNRCSHTKLPLICLLRAHMT